MKNLGIMLLTLAATGCTAVPADDDAPPPGAGKAEEVWRTDLDVLGQPEVTGDTALVLARARRDELDLVALDVTTGDERWRMPYSPGDVPTGYGLSPAVVTNDDGRELVVLQRPGTGLGPGAGWYVPLVAVEPDTGEVVGRQIPVRITSPLSSCIDGTDACAGGGETSWRFDLDRPSSMAGPDTALPMGSRELDADGLFENGQRPGEEIGRSNGRRVVWSRPVEDIMGFGRSSDYGWEWSYDPEADRFTGSVGSPIPSALRSAYERGDAVPLDLERRELVSIRGRNGAVVWSDSAVQLCGPDAGEDEAPAAVRCRITGESISEKGRPVRYRDLQAFVEGYDERGEVVWRVEMSEAWAKGLLRGGTGPVTGSDRMVGQTPEDDVRIDLADGSLERVAPAEVFLCLGETETTRYAVPWNGSSKRQVGQLAFACDASGRRSDAALTEEAVRLGGVPAGEGRRLVATDGAVTAYAVTGEE